MIRNSQRSWSNWERARKETDFKVMMNSVRRINLLKTTLLGNQVLVKLMMSRERNIRLRGQET